jgi:peptide chain release factor subunit 1
MDLEQIKRLASFDSHGACVLSAFLNLAPQRQVERTYRTIFKDLHQELGERLDEPRRAELDAESTRVAQWLDANPPQGRALAIFSCAPAGLWEAFSLQVPVPDRLAFEATPYVAPLLDLLDEYERYAVALVDKEKARIFSVFLGEIEEEHGFKDFVPGKHDQGGVSQANFQRHHEAHVFRHLKRAAEYLTELYRHRPFDRLILAGPEEATSELRRLLPRALASRVVAAIPAETFAGTAEILERTLEIEHQIERTTENRLLTELFETAAAGGLGTVGVDRTLEALFLGEVRTLVVADGAPAEGSECPNCGRLTTGRPSACPACGNRMDPVADVFERAIDWTLARSGRVEVVHNEPAQRLLEAGGGMGAFLRYTT